MRACELTDPEVRLDIILHTPDTPAGWSWWGGENYAAVGRARREGECKPRLPATRSTYGDCHGLRGALTTSSLPSLTSTETCSTGRSGHTAKRYPERSIGTRIYARSWS